MQHLSREPLPTEWERVRVNASRIRRLVSYTRDYPPRVHSRFLQPLFALFPPTSLFLNLIDLDFSAVADLRELTPKLQFSLLRQFLSHKLGFLAFRVPSGAPAQDLEQFVDILPVEASSLRQLVIAAETDGAPPRQIHLPLIKMQKLNALGIIRNACLTKHSIAVTKHMRSLRCLALHLKGSDALEGWDDMPLLSLLECLALDADNIQQCRSFLSRVSTPRLSSLGIKYIKRALPEEVDDFFVFLQSSFPAPASLKSIFVHRHGDVSHGDLDLESPLPSHIFRPLLKFRRLTTVKLLAMGEYCLDDNFIQEAAVAWPDIQELWFASKQADSLVTFGAVLSLASRCRSLRSLQLTFDATRVPRLPHRKENEDPSGGSRELWPKQTSFQALHVGNSKLPKCGICSVHPSRSVSKSIRRRCVSVVPYYRLCSLEASRKDDSRAVEPSGKEPPLFSRFIKVRSGYVGGLLESRSRYAGRYIYCDVHCTVLGV